MCIRDRGNILSRTQFPTWKGNSKDAFFNNLFSSIQQLFAEHPNLHLIGIGIDAPSCVPEEGIIKAASNLPLKGEVPIVDIFTIKYKKPVFLCNDANAAALGEGKFGNAKHLKNYIVVTLGTGLGAGIVVNGQLLVGQSGLASELGHIVVQKDGRQCGCGKKGCLETYTAASGIKRNFLADLVQNNNVSSLEKLPIQEITTKIIGKAAKSGDITAINAFKKAGTVLGESLANIVHLFEPEAIILAGGVAEVGEILFTPTINALFENLLPNYIDSVNILPSALAENEAALLGARCLVFSD